MWRPNWVAVTATPVARACAAALLFISLITYAFWQGESGQSVFSISPIFIGVAGTIAFIILLSMALLLRVVAGLAFLALFVMTLMAGSSSFQRAFNSCVQDGEVVRTQLLQYHAVNGRYPDSLELAHVNEPCARKLHQNLLQYERTSVGFRLTFQDWLADFSATDATPFNAQK